MSSSLSDHMVEILLVEDNVADVELTLHALRRNNVANEIHVARDGVEALEFVFGSELDDAQPRRQRLRVILLDLKLPRVDGLEVLRTLKTSAETKSIPVVMLTSSREERDLVESYQLGVNSYIVKPVDFEQFNEAIRQLGFYWVLLNERPNG